MPIVLVNFPASISASYLAFAQRTYPFSLSILVAVNSRGCGWGAPSCAFCEHNGASPPRSLVFLSLSNLARRDLTGGADLGARPPAAGFLHRAGCEDGWAGQRQGRQLSLGQESPDELSGNAWSF